MAVNRLGLFVFAFGHPFRVPAEEIVATAESGVRAPGFVDALDALDYRLSETGRLDEIPVTIAWGSRDVLLPHPIQSRRARSVLPAARHITLRGCGHVPFYDDPGLCARVLLEGSS
jgi:pimeloyl-ACP methyl ester carboxylesterase